MRLRLNGDPGTRTGGPQVAIVTVAGDLHALAVRNDLEERHQAHCGIVESDRLPGRGGLTWSNLPDSREFAACLPSDRGDLRVADLDVIWWRRGSTPPFIPDSVTEDAHRDLVTNDTRAAVLGMLATRFTGTWVSDPLATRQAENKLLQLQVAEARGFRVPRTLVSQHPDAIRRFCAMLDNRVVVKPVRGTRAGTPLAHLLDERLLQEDDAMALAPAMYQEYVPGERHVRAHVFGERVYAAVLESEALDWRADMNIPVHAAPLEEAVEGRLRDIIGRLGLVMGVVDLKLADDGEPVWLEVNPQGQFLFIEGLARIPLTAALADFLVEQAERPLHATPSR